MRCVLKMKDNRPDEIINSLLKGTLDSIKEESLDIDLSVCATIPSTSNAYSMAPDFWMIESQTSFPDISIDRKKNKRKSSRPKKTSPEDNFESDKSDKDIVDFEMLSVQHDSHEITFTCSQCDKTFNNEGTMKKHLKSHNTGSRKDSVMECPDCGKMLKISSMWMHRKIHTDSKRYCCDICGQKFVQKINLTHHTKVHTGEKPFECPQCQKSFPERSHLLRHQRYHSTTRPFKCEKCGKMYKTERCLKVHNLVHLEQRPFVCKVCSKSFISSSKLKQHSNIHTGERPYKCNYCSRDFTNFPNWLKHTRRRHKVDHKTGKLLETVPKYSTKQTRAQKITSTPIASENPKEKLIETLTAIKNEHRSTSLTCSEDLIMEQALELEESGLYATNGHKNLFEEGRHICDNISIKNEFSSYISSPFSSPMEESGNYPNMGRGSQDFFCRDNTDVKDEICSYNSSPLSSPNYDFNAFTPLPSITTMTGNNFFLKTSSTLPSVETLFAFSHQKTQPDM